MGTLVENGVSMGVTATVALFDADKPALRFFLLLFQPTADLH